MITPTIGRVVLIGGALHNGSTEHPAIITRVWNEVRLGVWMINVTMFADMTTPQLLGSINLYETKEAAEAAGQLGAHAYWMPYQIGQAKKTEELQAKLEVKPITFDEFVEYGKAAVNTGLVNGVPWSFQYKGHPVTHEHDDCYLIANGTPEGLRFERGDLLVEKDGRIGVRKELPPFAQRLLDEQTEVDARLTKLTPFLKTEVFARLPEIDRDDLVEQHDAMSRYSNVLARRVGRLPKGL